MAENKDILMIYYICDSNDIRGVPVINVRPSHK